MIARLLAFVARFLGPADNSIKGIVNTAELWRVVSTAALSGLIATAVGIVVAVQGDLSNIIEVPLLVGPATTALTAILDYLRRKQHGS